MPLFSPPSPSFLLSRLSFLTQVQMSRDIRCKSNRRRDDIPFPREAAQCARERRLKSRRREKGDGGCSELGTEIHYVRRARGGKERFIRRDNNKMNVGAAATELLSIKGFRRILPGSRDNKSRRSSFAIGRAGAPEAAAVVRGN